MPTARGLYFGETPVTQGYFGNKKIVSSVFGLESYNGTVSTGTPIALSFSDYRGSISTAAQGDFTAAINGEKPAASVIFTSLSVNFPRVQTDALAANGIASIVTLEPWAYIGPEDPTYTLSKIINGDYDIVLQKYFSDMRDTGYIIYLRWAHEMNGSWYPWGDKVNGNQVGEYVTAWRHVWDIAQSVNATNVRWVWCPNVIIGANPGLSQFYPGDNYVDVVGVDGYNFGDGSFRNASDIFSPTFAEIRKFTTKQIWICETASAEIGGDKAAWIREFFNFVIGSNLGLVNWFNFNKEKDWRYDSSPAALAAFRAGIALMRQTKAARVLYSTATTTPPVVDPAPTFDPSDYSTTRKAISFAGGSFGDNTLSVGNPGAYNSNWFYEVDGQGRNSNKSFAAVRANGIDTVRVDFRWERLQPTLNAAFNSAEAARITAMLDAARSAGVRVILECHNYGHFKGVDAPGLDSPQGGWSLGQDALPYTAFVDLWKRAVARWGSHSALWGWELMNEPVNIAQTGVVGFAPQKVINTYDTSNATGRNGGGAFGVVCNGTKFSEIGSADADLSKSTSVAAWIKVASSSTATSISVSIQDIDYQYVEVIKNVDVPADGVWHQIIGAIPDRLKSSHRQFAFTVSGNGNHDVALDDLSVGTTTGVVTNGLAHWKAASQAAVAGIRSTGDAHPILVAGYEWSDLRRFNDINGAAWISDPLGDKDKLVYVAHHYWDSNHAGVYGQDTPVSLYGSVSKAISTIVDAELQGFINWSNSNNVRIAVTEYGWPCNQTNQDWAQVGAKYLAKCFGTGVHTSYWSSGSLWGDYELNPFTSSGGTIVGLRPGVVSPFIGATTTPPGGGTTNPPPGGGTTVPPTLVVERISVSPAGQVQKGLNATPPVTTPPVTTPPVTTPPVTTPTGPSKVTERISVSPAGQVQKGLNSTLPPSTGGGGATTPPVTAPPSKVTERISVSPAGQVQRGLNVAVPVTPPVTPPTTEPPVTSGGNSYALGASPVYFNDLSAAALSTDWASSGTLTLVDQKLVANNTGGNPYTTWQPDLISADMAIKADVYRSTQRGSAKLRIRCGAPTSSTTSGLLAEWQFDKDTWDLYYYDGATQVAIGSAPAGLDGDSVTFAAVGATAWLTVETQPTVSFPVPQPSSSTAVRHVGFSISTANPKWGIGNVGVYTATASVSVTPAQPVETNLTPLPAGSAPALRFPRPAGWETWRTIYAQGTATVDGPERILLGGGNVKLVLPKDRIIGPLRLEQATNVLIVGGKLRALPVSNLGPDAQRLIYVPDGKGTIHLEGIEFDGAGEIGAESDAFAINGAAGNFVIQSCRVYGLNGTVGGNHADGLQIWNGVKTLKVHNFEVQSGYQGIKYNLRRAPSSTQTESVLLSNVDLIALAPPPGLTRPGYLLWPDETHTTVTTLENVRAQPFQRDKDSPSIGLNYSLWPPTNYAAHPEFAAILSGSGDTQTVSWPAVNNVQGVVSLLKPSTPRFVPAGVPGLRYREDSPATSSGPPAPAARRTDYGSYRPDTTTTGTYAPLVAQAGNVIISTAGAVVENLDVAGRIEIQANNVTVRNCKVRGEGLGAGYSGALIFALATKQTGAVIEDCTVAPTTPTVGMNGIQGGAMTVRRCDVSRTTDGIDTAGNDVTVVGNYIHDLSIYASDPSQSNGSHSDGMQIEGGSRILVRGNAIYGVKTTINNSCQGIIVTQNYAVVNDLIINANYISAGYTPLNMADKAKGAMSGVLITNNQFQGDQTNPDNVHLILSIATFNASIISDNTVLTGTAPFKSYKTAT